MENNTKKVLFAGFIYFMILSFFRNYAFNYSEFLSLTAFLIISSVLVLRYLTKRDIFYNFPLYIYIAVGIFGIIAGLTQFSDNLLGALTLVIGIWMIVVSVVTYFLKPFFDRFLLNVSRKDQKVSTAGVDAALALMYFTFIARDYSYGYNTIGIQIFNVLIIVVVLVIIYFIAQYLVKRFLSKLRFDFIYSALAGVIGISLYLRFNIANIEEGLLVQFSIFTMSLNLFIVISLIKDFFKTINE